MKRIFMGAMVVMLCNSSVLATHCYQSLRRGIESIGQKIENVNNVPVVGKLLPFAILAASLKECPIQTMMVLAGVLGYTLSQNEAVRDFLNQYDFANDFPWIKRRKRDVQLGNDMLFVFDGQDEDDAEDQADAEDSLLDSDLLGDELSDNKNKKRTEAPRALS